MSSSKLTVPVLPLVVAVLRFCQGLANDTIPIQDGPAFRTSIAREYRQKVHVNEASRVPQIPQTALDVVYLLVELSELVKVDRKFRAFASAPGGTKVLLMAMCLPFCKAGGYADRLYALQPFMVWKHHEFHRLVTSVFLHGDIMHLLNNLMSLTYNGSFLEVECGRAGLAVAIASLTASPGALEVLYSRAFKRFDDQRHYFRSLSIGASGLAYGLQVVADYRRLARFWPFVPHSRVPLQYMCWETLLYNQLVKPQASFSGHMCGILAGLVHVFLPKAVKGVCYACNLQHETAGKQRPSDDELLEKLKSLQDSGALQMNKPIDGTANDTMDEAKLKVSTDTSACEWSHLRVHAMCAVLCCCAHQAGRLVCKDLRRRARRRNRWNARVQEAFLGDRNINKQQQPDKSRTRSTSGRKAERKAVATRKLHSARFL